MEPSQERQKPAQEPRVEEPKRRFQILKLEERIAPGCHLNQNGKFVGCGRYHYRGH